MPHRKALFRRNFFTDSPVRLVRGEGAFLFDEQGTRYLDLVAGSGAVSCGHANPIVNRRIHEQLDRLVAPAVFDTPVQDEAIEALDALLPAPLKTIALYSTGAEAVEFALRLARRATGRESFCSMRGHFHGKTHGAMFLHGYVPGVYGPRPEGFAAPVDWEALNSQEQMMQCLREQHPAPAAIIYEPVMGYSGPAELPDWMGPALRAHAAETGSLLIADEIFTGMHRCGPSFVTAGAPPDILIFGKGAGNGLPVSIVAATPEVARSVADCLPGSTFAANCVACAAILGVIECLRAENDLQGRVQRLEQRCLQYFPEQHSSQKRLHAAGRGGLLSIRFEASQEARLAVLLRLWERGVIAAYSPVGIRLSPPLLIEDELWSAGLTTIRATLDEMV